MVLDKFSHKPVEYATIHAGQFVTSTAIDGKFSLYNMRFDDTLMVSRVGYIPYTYTIYNIHADTIYIEPALIQLQDVYVRTRNYKADSLSTRREFTDVFNYQKPALKDFLKTNLPTYIPDHGPAINSDNDFGGLNLLEVVSLFSKNKTPSAKLQKQLLDDEEANYVDHKFSKSKVEVITHMQGDSLQDFINTYRPTITRLKQMTDYELLIYIKESYTEFVKTYNPGENEVFKKP